MSPSHSHPRRWVLLALLAAAVVGSGYYVFGRESPEDAYAAISAAAAAGDYGAVWDRYDDASRARMGGPLGAYPGATDRDRFAAMLAADPGQLRYFLPAKVLGVGRKGDRAAVVVDRPNPGEMGMVGTVYLVRVNGRWCLSDGADLSW